MKKIASIAGALILSACASTGIVPMGKDTYMVSKQTATGFQPAVGITAEILQEANEFCQKQGLVMVVVSLNSKDGVPGRSYATAELVFKALRPDDPEYLNSKLQRSPDQVRATPSSITSTGKSTVTPSDVDNLTGSAKIAVRKHAYAVVIGIEEYQQKLPRADYAAHDAEIMGQYLTKALGYKEENVVTLLNERATKTSMEKYVEGWLFDRVEKDDSVFIYYSGHGAPNPKSGKAYLVPYDGDPAFVEQTGYPLERLYERLSALPAKEVVVMLDSCFSGAGGRSVIAKGMRPMVLSVENPLLTKGRTMVLTAGAGDQVSSTYDQKSHGLLTYFFLKGLQGEADQNNDRRIELRELFEYLKPQVERTARREFHNEQTPQLIGSPDTLSKGVVLIESNK